MPDGTNAGGVPKAPQPLLDAVNEVLAAVGNLRREMNDNAREHRRALEGLAERLDRLERDRAAE